MKALQQSKTGTIKRSQINLNPINPKRHTEEAIKLQAKNFRKVGFLGGIVWNRLSGNLIDGHRRVYAMDAHYKYDGTPETDYDIKVEVVEMDEKTEKEQLTYMAVGNTRADVDLIAKYIGEIDYSSVGLGEKELEEILAMSGAAIEAVEIEEMDDIFFPSEKESPTGEDERENKRQESEKDEIGEEKSYEDRKEHMKNVKAQVREQAYERERLENAFVTVSFSTTEAKEEFCDIIGINTDAMFAKGEEVMKYIR